MSKITSISFLPVCSNCRHIINEEVDVDLESGSFINAVVTPRYCSHCGSFFDRIVMPTKLPFKEEMELYLHEEENV